jgi:hypothetical protein
MKLRSCWSLESYWKNYWRGAIKLPYAPNTTGLCPQYDRFMRMRYDIQELLLSISTYKIYIPNNNIKETKFLFTHFFSSGPP